MAEQLSFSFFKNELENIPKIVWVIVVDFIEYVPYILIAQRFSDAHGDITTYTFPGGKIENGETPQAAALRELEEETGIVLKQDHLINAYPKPILINQLGGPIICHGFFALYDEFHNQKPENKEPTKHADWIWMKLSELHAISLAGGLPHVVFSYFWQEILKEVIELSKLERERQQPTPAAILTLQYPNHAEI